MSHCFHTSLFKCTIVLSTNIRSTRWGCTRIQSPLHNQKNIWSAVIYFHGQGVCKGYSNTTSRSDAFDQTI